MAKVQWTECKTKIVRTVGFSSIRRPRQRAQKATERISNLRLATFRLARFVRRRPAKIADITKYPLYVSISFCMKNPTYMCRSLTEPRLEVAEPIMCYGKHHG